MRIDVLTLFPDMFHSVLGDSVIGRGIKNNCFEFNAVDIRDFSENKHRKVDDYPYGGGDGMVLCPDPVYGAYNSVKSDKSKVVFLSPQGKVFDQEMAKQLSKEEHLIFLCGHYEGVDQRVLDEIVDMEISIGDFVVTGGEIPAMAVIDSVCRLLPGVLPREECYTGESHYNGLLEYPQYTRPNEFLGVNVPEVLLSGHHANIVKWQLEKSLEVTKIKRPDMYEKWINENRSDTTI